MIHTQDRTTHTGVTIKVNTAQNITSCSKNHVSEHKFFSIGEASQKKGSITESQNSRQGLRRRGRRIIKKPDTQQQRIRFPRLYSHDGHIMQRFADGYIVIIGHHSQEKKFCSPKEDIKEIWLKQALVVMVLFPLDMMQRYLGTQAIVNEISKKKKFEEKNTQLF